MKLKHKDLLGLAHLAPEEIDFMLHTAVPFKKLFTRSIKKVPPLRGKTVAMLFYEPSTRTRTSFELAAARLSADVLSLAVSSSSVQKGETLMDTARNLEAMKIDFIVLRHSVSGAPELLARGVRAHVVNAGDGNHEHPTQGLLDLFTIREKKKKIQGLQVAIIGDILHSRVARSNIWGLTKLGARVRLCGPATLIPAEMKTAFGNNVDVTYNMKDALDGADVAYVLRLQLERQQENLFPSLREYHDFYGLDAKKLSWAKKDCLVMHPGPMNRGVEIDSSVADGPQSVILDQVTNGIAVRMAVLYLLAGSSEGAPPRAARNITGSESSSGRTG
ncbi:MAG: aspartate carbamoyltransferase [Elusimicrobia bacterium RIFCSPLOWO2_01_FULL_59_12]|nr:MAG: aspartate carbamoyltransferase [Elusimicrobia bacterium RIFCSPLOWO2_01_FULL_59_12]